MRICSSCRGPIDTAAGSRHPCCDPGLTLDTARLIDALRLLADRLGARPMEDS